MFGIDDALGSIGGLVGSIIGNGAASGDQEASRKALLDALAAYTGLEVPDLQTMIQASSAGPSAMGGVATDPALRDRELATMTGLQQLVDSGGMTLGDRVAQEQAMTRSAQAAKGQREAVLQEMARRGQLGGGAELAGKLSAAEGAGVGAYNAGSSAAASAQQRALQAMIEGGNVAGRVRGEDFGEAARKAAAADAMAQFNASQRSKAYGQNFGMNYDRASGIAGSNRAISGYNANEAQATRDRYRGYGEAIGGAAAKVGKAIATPGVPQVEAPGNVDYGYYPNGGGYF